MEQTFGGFVRQRRSSMGITLRGLAARLGLSPVYMSNIETDRKPAPTQEYLEKLAQELHLNVDERRYLLDLAAKSKEQCVSADLPEYIMERDIVRAALRTAKEVDATDEEWQAFIDRLTQRDKDQKGGYIGSGRTAYSMQKTAEGTVPAGGGDLGGHSRASAV